MSTTAPLAVPDGAQSAERLKTFSVRLPMDEWAAARRIVPRTSPMPGPWDHANAPMGVEPMRAFTQDGVRNITIVAPTQLFKSELAINVALYVSTHGDDVLFYEPDEELAREFLADRIRPSLLEYDTELITGGDTALKKRDSTLTLRLGGGGAIRALTPKARTGTSSRSARVVVLDEIDRMGDPRMMTYATSRVTSYGADGRIVAVSTPTIDGPGTVWRLWTEGSRGEWHGRCVHCGDLVPMDWGQVHFDKDRDGYWLPNTAEFRCALCTEPWTEPQRLRAILAGQFVHADPDNPHRSFWVPGPAHLRRTIRDIATVGAKAWCGAQEEADWETYKVWTNEFAAEVWSDEHQGLSSRTLQRSTYSLQDDPDDTTLGALDPRTLLITVGADVGGHGLYAEWVAWGIDPDSLQVTVNGLQYEIIGCGPDDTIDDPEIWARFAELLRDSAWRFPAVEGVSLPFHRAAIDSRYFPVIVKRWVYEQARLEQQSAKLRTMDPRKARIMSIQSKAREGGPHPIDFRPGLAALKSGKQRPPVAVVSVESNQLKEALYDITKRDQLLPNGAKLVSWPADLEARGYTPGWFNEFTNEVRSTRRTAKGEVVTQWLVKHEHGRKNEAFDCFDEETEVLTHGGWKPFAELTTEDVVATVNLDTDAIEYQSPLCVIAKPYCGRMLAITNSRVDLLVTPTHRMVTYQAQNGKWTFDNPRITMAKDLHQGHGLKVTGMWRGQDTPQTVGSDVLDPGDLAEFLGWYVSEGCRMLNHAKTQGNRKRWRVQISQNPGAKFDRIVELCQRLPWKAQIHKDRIVFTRQALYDYVGQCGDKAPNKRVPPWIKEASPQVIERFLDAAIAGDGWIHDGHRAYATVSRGLADDIQELFLKIGKTARIQERPAKPWNIEGRSGNTTLRQYHVHERRTQTISLRGKVKDGYGLTVHPVEYDGHVYCATVPNGTLIVRRKGIPVVAGNCRVYALAAAMIQVFPCSLRDGLLRLALVEAEADYPTVFDEAADAIRLDVSGGGVA